MAAFVVTRWLQPEWASAGATTITSPTCRAASSKARRPGASIPSSFVKMNRMMLRLDGEGSSYCHFRRGVPDLFAVWKYVFAQAKEQALAPAAGGSVIW